MTLLLATIAMYAVASGPLRAGWLEKGQDLIGGLAGDESGGAQLGADELRAGLKEALRVGTETVVSQLGQTGGFNSDPAIHIPLPQSLDTVKATLDTVGMGSMLDDLELKLNRAAEAATPKAKALFLQSIQQMTLEDAQAVYSGPDDAATRYFEDKMSAPLTAEMSPVVSESLSQVGAIAAYDKVMSRYQNVPFAPDVKADLSEYVVSEGIGGIFYYLAKEEAAIRQDPAKRTTDILKKVFGKP
ncbi:MAG: DUF4197 domain-containing protein [Gammaproteobacteria bacterium]|nr:DUF4197 domain-containing protein [Gammaproteobacteria bacterium]MBA3730838.1 DUF4197 domain-containing protein [Gammaproteobacteria bacterium]